MHDSVHQESYKDLLLKMRQIECLIKKCREIEIEDIKQKIFELNIYPSEIFPSDHRLSGRKRNPPRYKDPRTGKSWSGRGRAPDWIAGKDRTPFLMTHKP